MATILCVDDEPAVGVVLEHTLTKLGHRPLLAESVAEAMKTVNRTAVDLILADYRMPQATGIDLLGMLREEGFGTPVIVMTAYSSIENAIASIRNGAVDYLTKPIRAEALEIAVDQALEVARLRREHEAYRSEVATIRAAREIVGESEALRSVMRTVAMIAPTRATVLLQGESGTGKELVARAIHEQSPRHDKPFVSLNCAAMPEGLVESALFGHERGAFTGATARTPGAFERADGGTLLLDEISEMRLDLQAKLLRVLQEQEFERVGGKQPIRVDVRVIATTNRHLKSEVDDKRFREDLYYRLNVVCVDNPPLRDRLEDIPLLCHHFAKRAAREHGIEACPVGSETINLLKTHSWPGNVRELSNVVERAVILSRNGELDPEVFRAHIRDHGDGSTPVRATAVTEPNGGSETADAQPAGTLNLRELEGITIGRALEETGGNRTRAARLLGISERTLRNKLNSPKRAN